MHKNPANKYYFSIWKMREVNSALNDAQEKIASGGTEMKTQVYLTLKSLCYTAGRQKCHRGRSSGYGDWLAVCREGRELRQHQGSQRGQLDGKRKYS